MKQCAYFCTLSNLLTHARFGISHMDLGHTSLVIPAEEGDDESVLPAYQLCGKPSVKTCGSCSLAFCNECAAGHTY